jgi:putative transcriptional regulator
MHEVEVVIIISLARYFSVFVLIFRIIAHDEETGTLGVILNRPSTIRMGKFQESTAALRAEFPDNPVYVGGPVCTEAITALHNMPGTEALEVSPGLYAGGFEGLINASKRGLITNKDTDHIRFAAGHSGWAPGQLEEELQSDSWYICAASPDLITSPCIQRPIPLWIHVLDLMGGKYVEIADQWRS